MNFWTGIILSIIFLIATIIVFAVKIFYPHHRTVAIIIYAVGWAPFLYSMVLRKRWLLQQKDTVISFFSVYYIHIIFGLVMLLALYFLLILFPVAKSPFTGMDNKQILRNINEDKTIILYLDEKLSHNLDSAIKENILDADFKDITDEKKQELKIYWTSCIEALLELDRLKEKYKTFYQLNPVTKKGLHSLAFKNGYAAFLAQLYYALKITEAVTDENMIAFFNEGLSEHGLESNSFDMLKQKLTDNNEIVRLNAGRAYNSLITEEDKKVEDLIEKYLAKIDSSLGQYSELIIKKPLNFFEKNSFRLWFPVQKEFAKKISRVKVSNRNYFITTEQINNFKSRLLPGDILLERREWHATNVGIPGFWTHSALYIGTLDDMEKDFKGLPELKNISFENYIEKNYPQALEKLKAADEAGYKYSVIESKRPGVILASLEKSANSDSLAVLRVSGTDKSDRLKIVAQALKYYGRPYDFDFNFVTDNALVCSELVYKAYAGITKLNFEPEEFNGRLIIFPNQFAEKYSDEYNSQNPEFNLVLFLDGNEKTGIAAEKDADEFVTTWQRPKWHIAKDFINF